MLSSARKLKPTAGPANSKNFGIQPYIDQSVALTKMVEVKAGIPGFGEVTLRPYEAQKAVQEQIDRGDIDKESGSPQQLNFLFLIDDIDRCLSDKAVEMLEAIKLFLDIPGCAFVLALDDEVVERGIAHRYRDYLDLTDRAAESIAYSLKPERYEDYRRRYSSARLPPITGHDYLEKIVQLSFRLPRWSKEEMREFLRDCLSTSRPEASRLRRSGWKSCCRFSLSTKFVASIKIPA